MVGFTTVQERPQCFLHVHKCELHIKADEIVPLSVFRDAIVNPKVKATALFDLKKKKTLHLVFSVCFTIHISFFYESNGLKENLDIDIKTHIHPHTRTDINRFLTN